VKGEDPAREYSRQGNGEQSAKKFYPVKGARKNVDLQKRVEVRWGRGTRGYSQKKEEYVALEIGREASTPGKKAERA